MDARNGQGPGSIELEHLERSITSIAHAGNADRHVNTRLDGQDGQDGRHPEVTHSRSKAKSDLVRRLKSWWVGNISPALAHSDHGLSGSDPRDYLALERTYLAWFRTSTALVSLGVVITQLFILHDLDPTKGKIFGAMLASGGICASLFGCLRYLRQQVLLAHGKTLARSWHISFITLVLGSILLSLFIIVLVED